MFPKLQVYIILNMPEYKHYALCKINHCIRVSGRRDNNTDRSTVSLASLVVSINVNIEITFSESGEFCCLWHRSLKFWKHSIQCPSRFEAVTVFFKLSGSFGLQKGAQQKALSYRHPLIQAHSVSCTGSLYCSFVVHSSNIHDQAMTLELKVQHFLLKHIFVHSSQWYLWCNS